MYYTTENRRYRNWDLILGELSIMFEGRIQLFENLIFCDIEKGITQIPIKLNLSWLDGFYTEFFTHSRIIVLS